MSIYHSTATRGHDLKTYYVSWSVVSWTTDTVHILLKFLQLECAPSSNHSVVNGSTMLLMYNCETEQNTCGHSQRRSALFWNLTMHWVGSHILMLIIITVGCLAQDGPILQSYHGRSHRIVKGSEITNTPTMMSKTQPLHRFWYVNFVITLSHTLG